MNLAPAPFLLIALGVGPAVSSGPGAQPLSCRIAEVVDAATFRVVCADRPARLHVPGIRAPKAGAEQRGGEPFATESRERAAEWLTGEAITVAPAVPGAGRSRVLLGDEDLSVALLERGFAFVTLGGAPDPVLVAAERRARSAGRGVWSHEAWRTHRNAALQPLPLPAPAQPAPRPTLGQEARQVSHKSWEERRAAFEEALQRLADESDDPD